MAERVWRPWLAAVLCAFAQGPAPCAASAAPRFPPPEASAVLSPTGDVDLLDEGPVDILRADTEWPPKVAGGARGAYPALEAAALGVAALDAGRGVEVSGPQSAEAAAAFQAGFEAAFRSGTAHGGLELEALRAGTAAGAAPPGLSVRSEPPRGRRGGAVAAGEVEVHAARGAGAGESGSGSAVAGWILMHVAGRSAQDFKDLKGPRVTNIRRALADALEVCRPSVQIIDLHAKDLGAGASYGDDGSRQVLQEDTLDAPLSPGASHLEQPGPGPGPDLSDHVRQGSPHRRSPIVRSLWSLLWGVAGQHVHMPHSFARRAPHRHAHRVNITQIRAIYEVAVFGAMRYNATQVSRRVDSLQSLGRYFDLDMALMRAMGTSLAHQEESGLDDVGYAAIRPSQVPLSPDDIADCLEEGRLHDARAFHQLVMCLAMLLLAFIACAGAAVFSVHEASSVPSRVNPLLGRI